MDAWAARRLRTYEDAERGLCFGRLDVETMRRPLYIGRRWVHDEEQRQLVVNWQAPAARAFYTATPQDPHGVTLRRRFRTDGRKLLDIADEALDGSIVDGAAVGDFLLEELERTRDARMRDIVATIQADQYRLITHDPNGPLVIQGGPGTGKTAVGLHRASWLLYTARERPAAPRRARRRAEPHVHGVRQPRAAGARRGQRRAARGRRARRRRRARAARPARGRGAEGRPAARRGRPPRGRAAARLRAGGARDPARGLVRLGAPARGARAARRRARARRRPRPPASASA